MSSQGHDWQGNQGAASNGSGLFTPASAIPWDLYAALHSLLAGHNRTPEAEQLLNSLYTNFLYYNQGQGVTVIFGVKKWFILDTVDTCI